MSLRLRAAGAALHWRPLLFAAGAAAASAGAVYLFCRSRGRAKITVDAEIQTCTEATATSPPEALATLPAEVPPAPPREVPATPPSEAPAKPPHEVPATAPPEIPATLCEVPATPCEVPAKRPPEVPATPPPEVPATPPEVPATPPDVPATPLPEVQATLPREIPNTPSCEIPGTPPCEVPATPLPEVPATLNFDVPATPPPVVPPTPPALGQGSSPQLQSVFASQTDPVFYVLISPEAAGYTFLPRAGQVPAMYIYSIIKRISSFDFKLNALRQAFAIVLSDSQKCSYISLVGRTILVKLADLNSRDLTMLELEYERLMAFTQNPSLRGVICTELEQIGIGYFSFIDVVFEVVVLGIMGGARPQIFTSPGGFLDQLMRMMFSFTPTSLPKDSRAERCLYLLMTRALFLLEGLFDGEEDVYAAHETLACAVWYIMERYMQAVQEEVQAF